MDQRNGIETVFENGKRVELDGLPTGPTGREIIEAAEERTREAIAAGTAHWERLEEEFRERQSTGRIEIEVCRVGSFTLEAATENSSPDKL